jgi:outer membrane protein OmpA-like peptidoglycan-associated protein/tetratricopeptide (TPR) repeat protein
VSGSATLNCEPANKTTIRESAASNFIQNRHPLKPLHLVSTLLTLLFITLSLNLHSQDYTTVKTTTKKALKCYDKAKTLSRSEKFPETLEQLNKALKYDPAFIDGKILRASVYGAAGNLEKAEKEFEEIVKLDASYSPRVLYELAITEKDLQKYDEAAIHFESYLASAAKSKVRKQKAEKHLINSRFAAHAIANPVPFEPINLGDSINSTGQEYLPSLTADQERLVFTARVGNQEDFYYSYKKDSVWQARQPLENINTPQNEGAQCISVDGRLLVFTRCDPRAGMGGCDLYFSAYKYGQWSDPEKIKGAVNSSAWDAQPSLSADGKTLYFASDRPGGFGKRDIWMSRQNKNGEWKKPVNLGETINTNANDQCPFIHADNQTLYFCSEGLPGMGGIDLYFAQKDSSGGWAKPQNIGFPINTTANEGTLTVSIDGKTAYYASDKDPDNSMPASMATQKPSSSLNIDIFSFKLHAAARPNPVTYVKAKVVNARSNRGLEASAEIIDLKTGKTVATTQADEKGSFLLCLPSGKDYAMHVSKEKYLFHSENFSLADPTSIEEPFIITISLQPVPKPTASIETPKEKAIVLKNVFFESGSADLKSTSTVELDRLIKLLTDNTSLNIQINGHTDNVGEETTNLSLSENRAKSVYNYLVKKGISIDRLRFKGFGETQPIEDNNTEEGRKANRRTEFVVW